MPDTIHASPVLNAELVWRADVGSPLMGTPSIEHGSNGAYAVFTYGGRSASCGGIVVINPETGAEIWRHDVGAGVEGGAVLEGARVYFGDQQGWLYCLDLSSRRELWSTQVEGAVVAPPLPSNGRLFAGTSVGVIACLDLLSGRVVRAEKVQSKLVSVQPIHVAQEPRSAPNDLTALHRIIAATFTSDELKTLCLYLSVDYDDLPGENRSSKARELVLFFSRRSELERLIQYCKRERPSVRWPGDPEPEQRQKGDQPARQASRIVATPVMLPSGDVLVGALDGGLYRFNAEQPGLFRVFDAGAALYAAPIALRGDGARLIIANHRGEVIALDAAGREVWRARTGKPIRVTPHLAGNVLYLGTQGRTLHALNTDDGAERWQVSWRNSITTTPLVNRGRVVFGDTQGCVICLDEVTKQVVWNFDAQTDRSGLDGVPAAVFGGFALYGGHLLFGAHNGCAYAVKV
ncbi:MAG: PQQ-like beta-propeller repeat protein [Chloroflexi bacterium]|nr:PQQ-like beta-propeller repeat protein [Chloroflexota bacterium]